MHTSVKKHTHLHTHTDTRHTLKRACSLKTRADQPPERHEEGALPVGGLLVRDGQDVCENIIGCTPC